VDPRRLLIFREIADSGSIAASARRLGWTQPAVSQHLRALEREARCALVLRTTRGVLLTEAGQVLRAHADGVAAQLRSAQDEITALVDLGAGTVRLAAFPSAAATIVPDALGALHRAHPGLQVRLEVAEPPEALELVRKGDVDLALVFDYDDAQPAVPAGIVTTALSTDQVVLILPAHRADGAPSTLAALRDEPWVAGCPRRREHLHRVGLAAGFDPDIRHSTDDYVVAQSLVAECDVVALLPRLALRGHRHAGVGIVELPGLGHRALAALHHKEAHRVPAVRAVLNALVTAAE